MWKYLLGLLSYGIRTARTRLGSRGDSGAVRSSERQRKGTATSPASVRTDFWKEFREGKREADARGKKGST